MKIYSSRQVARLTGVHRNTVIEWAGKNGVQKVDSTYFWTVEDLDRFTKRNKMVGRPKGSKK